MSDVDRMMALFEGFDGAHGTHGEATRNPEKHDKLEIKKTAKTVREPVTRELWEEHLSGARALGIIPVRRDNTCVWGAVDVDQYDMDLAEVATRVKDSGLPLVPCRTKSGGVHLYLFLSSPTPAVDIQVKLRDLAALLGFGGSEIFPKQAQVMLDSGDLGNWLNMPYHGGDRTERYGLNQNGRGLTLRQFLDVAEAARISPDDMVGLSAKSKAEDVFKDGPPCLQHLASVGFPEGGRNNGLFALGTFLKRKYPDKWSDKLEEHNQKHMRPPLPSAEVMQIINSLRKKDFNYKCSDQPMVSHCNSGLCRTRRHGVGSSGTMPVLSSLAMIDTDEPVWFLDVGGSRVELSTDDLQNPVRFQKKCMEVCHVVVPVLKRDTWQNILQGLMETLTVIEAPNEVSQEGQFFEHVESFCTDRHSAETRDDILLGKAWTDDSTGRVYFRMRDLQEYLEKQKFRGMTRTNMTNKLRKAGGDSHFINLKGRGLNLWWLPADRFERQTELHDLPEMKEQVL